MKQFYAVAAIASFALSGCAVGQRDALPGGVSFQTLRSLHPGTRGSIKFYNDTFGDATPDGVVAGPDGALWFTDPGNDVIGRITTGGSYTLEQSVGEQVSSGITVGPDKNLWFTFSNGIGRMKTNGTYTLFQDSEGSSPQGITTGPDGALWYAQSDGTVGRITTNGTISHFTVAPGNANLQGIATGPDGNLWVTQEVVGGTRISNQVIRLSPKGKHASYKVGDGPTYICVGPDKAMWFTESDANAIGRLTTSGKYREFPTNYEYAAPSGIAKGPDGALWISDFNGRFGIGRVTTKGKFSFYGGPAANAELRQITAGPDHNMWFTSFLAPEGIGRVTTR
ncbi:MAG: Virginiamycin B lyase [Candidatus Eremiobacteraeota bacterium]|nr:Virginiamycin B lyase [Candidatus Eremiobacteraeota bacterium]